MSTFLVASLIGLGTWFAITLFNWVFEKCRIERDYRRALAGEPVKRHYAHAERITSKRDASTSFDWTSTVPIPCPACGKDKHEGHARRESPTKEWTCDHG